MSSDGVVDRGAVAGERRRDREHLGLDAVQLLPAPRVGLVEVDLGAEEVAGVARVLLAADRLLVAPARGQLLLQERRELGVGRARLDRVLRQVGLERGGYVGGLGDLLGEHVACAAGPPGPGADLAGRLEHLAARADVTVVGLVEQGGAVVGQRLRHRAHPGRDRSPVVGRLGRHQVEGAADPVHGAVDDVDPRLGLVRVVQRELSVGPLEERALSHPLAVVGRRRPQHLGAGPAQQLLARGVAVRREVGQPVLVAGDAGERRHDRVGRSHVDDEALGDLVGLADGCGRRLLGHGSNLSPRSDSQRAGRMGRSCPWSSSRSPTRPSCRSASGATTSPPRSATTRSSCWPGRPAPARPRSCPRSASSSVAGALPNGGKMIGHTQPRRIAARSVAERIADELGTELGDLVGYQVRFTDRTSKRSRVKLMTDGILLAELQRDRDLRRYDTIIIDEAHERSLNIDFLLGYLKRLLPRRPDLKLIITSATIDVERFAEHFDAPVVEVSGRTYPVDVRYRPLVELPEADEEGEPIVRDQTEAIVDASASSVRGGAGRHPGVPARRAGDPRHRRRARRGDRPRTEIVPLYSRLSAAEQHKVFAAHTGRRVVLATNVAETSLTVPGHQVRRRHRRRADQPLLGAHQGAAAAGRGDQPGLGQPALRPLRPARAGHRDPALLRGGLRGPRRSSPTPRSCGPTWPASSCRWPRLGLGDMARFPFVEPPDRRNVSAGVQLLEELGALDGDRLTKVGRRLARLPIDPRLARMVLEAERRGCVREVIVIAAALSLQDPRERPAELQAAGRPAARAVQGRGQRLPHLAQPVALPQGAAARAVVVGVPADVQAGVPQLPPGPRVAGLRVAAAPGLQGDGDQARAARRRA